MDNWFNNNLNLKTVINMSDSGYTNNEIGLNFLQHFIEHTQSSSSSRYKMLLFDGADSHETKEFKQLARDHNIISSSLSSSSYTSYAAIRCWMFSNL
jgi:hypothetical protein